MIAQGFAGASVRVALLRAQVQLNCANHLIAPTCAFRRNRQRLLQLSVHCARRSILDMNVRTPDVPVLEAFHLEPDLNDSMHRGGDGMRWAKPCLPYVFVWLRLFTVGYLYA